MRRRSVAIRSRVAAACISRTTGGVATHKVLRMPWCRIRLRSVYSARSTASIDGCTIRAIADKNTLTGSLECRATRSSAICGRLSVRVRGSSRWRSASLARRCSASMCSLKPSRHQILGHAGGSGSSAQVSDGLHRLLPMQTAGNLRARRFRREGERSRVIRYPRAMSGISAADGADVG